MIGSLLHCSVPACSPSKVHPAVSFRCGQYCTVLSYSMSVHPVFLYCIIQCMGAQPQFRARGIGAILSSTSLYCTVLSTATDAFLRRNRSPSYSSRPLFCTRCNLPSLLLKNRTGLFFYAICGSFSGSLGIALPDQNGKKRGKPKAMLCSVSHLSCPQWREGKLDFPS